MACILHIETATDVCSVALAEAGQVLAWREEQFQHHNDHSRNLTLFVQECLGKAGKTLEELKAVAVSSGPGSYSSLRVGTSVAKGICYALDIPLIGIDTLQALALAAQRAMPIDGALYIPMIDARRMEVYYRIFDDTNSALTEAGNLVLTEDAFSKYFSEGKTLVFTGNGAQKAQQLRSHPKARFADLQTSARHLVELTFLKYQNQQFEDLAYFAPFYLKPPNITTPRKRAF
ncbi:MAG: tRNA (adenosine(37)-N6)-threonylcarbamoyltransferase complex dimerization subunit type 1 TsaB [Saprospirales bacterium]|nr:tRNA (adenosine(37)-N6)-threonylcarbamoyltransferase complex dimerization subunit type 1 TsaB [Saprospirales bacterium]